MFPFGRKNNFYINIRNSLHVLVLLNFMVVVRMADKMLVKDFNRFAKFGRGLSAENLLQLTERND